MTYPKVGKLCPFIKSCEYGFNEIDGTEAPGCETCYRNINRNPDKSISFKDNFLLKDNQTEYTNQDILRNIVW